MRKVLLTTAVLLLVIMILVGGGSQQVVADVPGAICPDNLQQSGLLSPGDPFSEKIFLPFQLSPCSSPVEIPFYDSWATSAHNNATADAFHHWDTQGEIPTSCAKCHSSWGYLDFLGVDGSEPGVVDKAAPIGSTIDCKTCHNDATLVLTSVTFPSGETITNLGDESRCMICHQGRESKISVDQYIIDKGADSDVDAVNTALSFRNIHYFAAAATQYGTLAKGGYEYDGMAYDLKFQHVQSYDQCIECHDPHTLQVQLTECATCHTAVTTVEDLKDVRMKGSTNDYDGDGNTTEGMYYEIVGLQEMLYTAIQTYANEVSGTPIVYEGGSYPYFFIDTNANGQPDPDEINYGNRYNAWTARLLKATYNYQVSLKDPGAFAHNSKYIIQLLHDSIADLNTMLSTPVDLSGAHRNDVAHFAGSTAPFRHWDGNGEVRGSCARCHSSEGLPTYHKEGANISADTTNGFMCSTCHANVGGDWARYVFDDATFPSGATATFGTGEDDNICMQCHQGRESGVAVADAIAGKDADAIAADLRFINIHYLAAGATLFGSDVTGMYEYAGKSYNARNTHVDLFDQCTECHSTHRLQVKWDAVGSNCSLCHPVVTSEAKLHDIRWATTPDYDGDGNTTEGVAGEIQTMEQALYTAIQAYAVATTDVDPIIYSPTSYPYFFKDTNGNGVIDPGEAVYGNRYTTWTPRLLRAAYNFHYVMKDPGGFAHNSKYIVQALFDTLDDMGVDVSGMIRP